MIARERLLRLVVLLLGRPYQYTKAELEERFEVARKGLDDDFQILRRLELLDRRVVKNRHTYAILPDTSFPELARLQPLNEDDKRLLYSAFRYLNNSQTVHLKRKIESLYDFQKLGLQALRKPNLDKIDRLEAGIRNKQRVLLHSYRSSSSNTVADRQVEVFAYSPELDIAQGYEINTEKRKIKHYRLTRIERVTLLEHPWQHEGEHIREATDFVRVVSDNQLPLHLTLKPRAFNDLIERYPTARANVFLNADGKTYDFQVKVNAKLHGILPYALANYDQIEVHDPPELVAAMKAAAKVIEKG